jgi:nucleoside-diphosphate-sugar epimerase
MRVLITGGTGFIGSRLALHCLSVGHEVVVLGQTNTPVEAANRKVLTVAGARVLLGSVTDAGTVQEAVHDADVVYHMAAAQHEAHAPDRHFRDVNVGGTRNVLAASVSAGVGRFVLGSTIGVYGAPRGAHIHERSPLAPDNIYGRTKLEAEQIARSMRDQLRLVVVRISETYGPGDHRLLKLFKALKRGPFVLIGPGTNMHHPIFIDDLVEGLLLAATSQAAVGQTFVLAGKDALTTREMVATIAAQLGVTPLRVRLPLQPLLALAVVMEATLRPLGLRPPLHRRRIDFFRKSFLFFQNGGDELLGFVPKYSFAQGVEETATWYTAQGLL